MANTQIYQILPGRPFGRGRHGNVTLASDPHTRRRCSGTSGSNTLTISSGGFNNGDLIVIHKVFGLGSATEENIEVNQIVSGAGSTSLTLKNPLARTHLDNSTNGSQVIDIREYINVTVNSFTVTGWARNLKYGGLIAIAAIGAVSWPGTVTNKGTNGGVSSSDQGGAPGVGSGGGFRGGANSTDNSNAWKGEGWYPEVYPTVETQTTNDNGGGGGLNTGNGNNPGGGGGNGGSGSTVGGNAGAAGGAAGNAALTSFVFGGGGGGAVWPGGSGEGGGGGGSGGGGAILWLRTVNTITGLLDCRGGNGGVNSITQADGGGGAGGSILLNTETAFIGSHKLYAPGGSGDTSNSGGTGRIRINYGGTVSGVTTPSASTAHNPLLVAGSGGSFLSNFV